MKMTKGTSERMRKDYEKNTSKTNLTYYTRPSNLYFPHFFNLHFIVLITIFFVLFFLWM